MSGETSAPPGASRAGPAALIDLIRSPSLEARLAYPRLLEDVVRRAGGRLVWSGSVDMQLIGHDLERYEDVLISQFPDAGACMRAVALRSEWQPETIVSEVATHVARPWPGWAAAASGIALGAARLLRAGGPVPGSLAELDPSLLREQVASDLAPDEAQLHAVLAARSDSRVVMLNLLDYRERADYGQEAEDRAERSGEAAYRLYARNTMPLIGRVGGRLRWQGTDMRPLGEADAGAGAWDAVAAVQYPSREAFARMIASPRYQAGAHHRNAGLFRTRILACTSHAEFY